MRRYYSCIGALTIAIVILFLTSCSLFVPDDRFDGGKLLDSEEMSRIKYEIFATETETEDEIATAASESLSFGESMTEAVDTTSLIEEISTVSKEIEEDIESTLLQTEEILTESESVCDIGESCTEREVCSDESVTESEYETETPLTQTVYWTEYGTVWHLFEDCGHLKGSKSILSGSVEKAMEEGKIKLCSSCIKRQKP